MKITTELIQKLINRLEEYSETDFGFGITEDEITFLDDAYEEAFLLEINYTKEKSNIIS